MSAGTSRLHLAGEWLIGGFEAKGLAYVLVLFALGALAQGSWPVVWPLLGLAGAFHVLVGGWSVLAAGVAWIAAGRARPPLGQTACLGLAIGLLLALPGLIAAIHLNWGVDPATVGEANRIYVFTRLPHHLIPQAFPPLSVFRHILLVGSWLLLCRYVPADARDRPVRWFVATTIGFSLAGSLIAWLTLGHDVQAASLLRYYWFRMADIIVPLGVALEVMRGLALLVDLRPKAAQWCLLAAMLLAALSLGEVVLQRQREMRPQADGRINNLAAWKEICDWAATSTPSDAVFLTPRDAQSFHWYAGRSEVVSIRTFRKTPRASSSGGDASATSTASRKRVPRETASARWPSWAEPGWRPWAASITPATSSPASIPPCARSASVRQIVRTWSTA